MRYGWKQRKAILASVLVMVAWPLSLPFSSVAESAGAARETRRVVYLVPDMPTFLHYLSEWDGERRFPIFMNRNAYFERFVQAYKPEAILRAKARELRKVDADILRAAVCGAWGKETLADLRRGLSIKRFKDRFQRSGGRPRGIVLTDPDARQLPAALALAAAHRQALDFLSVSSDIRRIKPSGTMSFEQKEEIRKDIIKIIERWGYSYRDVGDDIDYITLGLDLPIGYVGTAPQTTGKQQLCLDDGINRLTPDGSLPFSKDKKKGETARGHCYAYVGRLLEAEEGMALYQAMCSIFLGTGNALYFDRWSEKLRLRAQEGWWVMQTKIPSTLVKQSQSSLTMWKRLVGDLNPYGFVHVSSSGNSRQWGDGKVSDIPESIPTIVYFAHSFSAANPYDGTTIAGRWLRAGAYIYLGSISEPFAQSFNMPRTAAVEAVGGEPLARAFLAKGLLPDRFAFPWKQIYIGDPLHEMRFEEDNAESEVSRKFREAVDMIRELKLGPAIEVLEDILESAEDAADRERIWWVLEKTFRLRYFAVRTRRMPVERHLDVFFVDCWYNDTYHPNGQPTTPVVLDKRLNLFARELVQIYQGLSSTVEEGSRLRGLLEKRIDELRQDAAFVKIWISAGPLTESEDASADNPFHPEKSLRLDASWRTRAGEVGWQPAMVNLDGNVLDLEALHGNTGSVIYTCCFPVLKRDGAAEVRLGVSVTGAAELWLNHVLVGSISERDEQNRQEEMFDFDLNPGENLLLFKVFRKGDRCELSARLTDRSGSYMEYVEYADPVAKLSAAGVKIDRTRWEPGK